MNKDKLKLLCTIYFSFFKLGLTSFGGGYAIIPLIEKEITENKKWVSREKVVDIFTVAQCLPGAIAINASTFVGFYVAGIPGAISALLGNVTPSVLIVLSLSALFMKFTVFPAVEAAFRGIYPVVVALILYAGYKIGKDSIKDRTGIVLAVLAFILSLVFNLDPIPVIIGGAVSGMVVTWSKAKLHKKTHSDNNSIKCGDL